MVQDESAKEQRKIGRLAFLVMGIALIMNPHSFSTSGAYSGATKLQQTNRTRSQKKVARVPQKTPRVD
jgi:hypothetical protein